MKNYLTYNAEHASRTCIIDVECARVWTNSVANAGKLQKLKFENMRWMSRAIGVQYLTEHTRALIISFTRDKWIQVPFVCWLLASGMSRTCEIHPSPTRRLCES